MKDFDLEDIEIEYEEGESFSTSYIVRVNLNPMLYTMRAMLSVEGIRDEEHEIKLLEEAQSSDEVKRILLLGYCRRAAMAAENSSQLGRLLTYEFLEGWRRICSGKCAGKRIALPISETYIEMEPDEEEEIYCELREKLFQNRTSFEECFVQDKDADWLALCSAAEDFCRYFLKKTCPLEKGMAEKLTDQISKSCVSIPAKKRASRAKVELSTAVLRIIAAFFCLVDGAAGETKLELLAAPALNAIHEISSCDRPWYYTDMNLYDKAVETASIICGVYVVLGQGGFRPAVGEAFAFVKEQLNKEEMKLLLQMQEAFWEED